jgi:hypothetical protein
MLIAGRHNDEMAVYYAGGAVLQLPIENQQAWLDCSDRAENGALISVAQTSPGYRPHSLETRQLLHAPPIPFAGRKRSSGGGRRGSLRQPFFDCAPIDV